MEINRLGGRLAYRGEPNRHENPALTILANQVFALAAGMLPDCPGLRAVQQSLVRSVTLDASTHNVSSPYPIGTTCEMRKSAVR
jgi:hypothetical protein